MAQPRRDSRPPDRAAVRARSAHLRRQSGQMVALAELACERAAVAAIRAAVAVERSRRLRLLRRR